MKTLSIVSSLIALSSFCVLAQPPAAQRPTGQVSIRATVNSIRPEKKKEDKADNDKKEKEVKTEVSIKSLDITLSGAKTVTGPLKLVTIFYGRDEKSKNSAVEKKFDSEITLDASQTAKVTTETVTFTSTPAHSKKGSDGKSEKVDGSGSNYYGWVVRVSQGDKLLGEAASSPPLLKITE